MNKRILKFTLIAYLFAVLLPSIAEASFCGSGHWPFVQPYFLIFPIYFFFVLVKGRFRAWKIRHGLFWIVFTVIAFSVKQPGIAIGAFTFYHVTNLIFSMLFEKKVVWNDRISDVSWYGAWSGILLMLKFSVWSGSSGLLDGTWFPIGEGLGSDPIGEFSLLPSLIFIPLWAIYIWRRDIRPFKKEQEKKNRKFLERNSAAFAPRD